MNALISGQAATAILIEGDVMHRVHFDDPDALLPCTAVELPRVFADVDDVVQFNDVTRDAALAQLEIRWHQDRSLHLVLILLDGQAEQETRCMAAECLEESLAIEAVSTFVANRLYGRPLPTRADPAGACDCCQQACSPNTEEFVEELAVHQPHIIDRVRAWESLPSNLFDSTDTRQAFDDALVHHGYFRRSALARDDAPTIDGVVLAALAEPVFQGLPNFRRVLMTWKDDCLLVRPRRRSNVSDEREEHLHAEEFSPFEYLSAHAMIERIEAQKDAIVLELRRGKLSLAHRYTDDLVDFQSRYSSSEQIGQSLCDLAQRAKSLSLSEDQLKFAERAFQVAPADPHTHMHRANAYLCAGQPDEALAAYDDTIEKFPNEPVGHTGRAEVLKSLGRLDGALAAYDDTIEKFPNNPVAHNGRAEVLKSLGRLDEALAAFDETIKKFPNDPFGHTGRAEVLKSSGRFDEALAAYDEAFRKFPTNSVTRTGRAEVLKSEGRLPEALEAYENAFAIFPSNPVTRDGLASTLVLLGRYTEAEEKLPQGTPQSKDDWIAMHIRGMILLKQGRLDNAVVVFERGLDCPFISNRPYFRTALATVELQWGNFRSAAEMVAEESAGRPLEAVIRLHAYGELQETDKATEAYEELRGTSTQSTGRCATNWRPATYSTRRTSWQGRTTGSLARNAEYSCACRCRSSTDRHPGGSPGYA